MAREEPDTRWNEVGSINCYALFMAYLLMAVRGLAYLVITWSTVVLLGGFVSNLGKKDFWSLTIITLVLTPRVSADVGLKEKLKYMGYSFYGLYLAIVGTLTPNDDNDSCPRLLLAVVVCLCHLLLVPIVVCPLAALYVCGPLLSACISIWRLIQHDYDNGKDEYSHLQPALNVLYSLAVLQGLLFCYRLFSFFLSLINVIFLIQWWHQDYTNDTEQVIHRIGSLIDVSQQQLDEDCAADKLTKLQTGQSAENYSKLLMDKGFDILHKLAADKENCRAMSNSQGLLSKVVAPLSSNLVHPIDHDATSTSIVAKSLQVLSLLMASPAETGAQLCSQISNDKEAIQGMERILSCRGCSEDVRILTNKVLTQLGMGIDEESLRVNKVLLGDILRRG
ncbi:uncharacterized protein [Aegilops tauschii subsp. strangulata]